MCIQALLFTADPAFRSELPASRRFFRYLRSCIFRSEIIYRQYLKLRYGAGTVSSFPHTSLPNRVLQNRAEWRGAFRLAKELHLPLHRAEEKNWDHLAAVHAIVCNLPKSAHVLDAGAELYSNLLPSLFVYGYHHLYGMNLSFSSHARRGPIQYMPGDITHTSFSNSTFDAITCMSVIEHGVPVEAFFREMFRILKPGGILITSTDYYPTQIDTRNQIAHGAPIRIFSKPDVEAMLAQAKACGFEKTGDLDLECVQRPIYWEEPNLDFTFLIFTLRKPARC